MLFGQECVVGPESVLKGSFFWGGSVCSRVYLGVEVFVVWNVCSGGVCVVV